MNNAQTKFISTYERDELDNLINEWLNNHPYVEVRDIKLSSSISPLGDDVAFMFTALIVYKRPPHGNFNRTLKNTRSKDDHIVVNA